MIRSHIFILILTLLNSLLTLSSQTRSTEAISSILDDVYKSDQDNRRKISLLQKEGKIRTPEFKDLALKMKTSDSLNLINIESILDQQGWPEGLKEQGNQTIFLVIQHANLDVQEKYLPLIRASVTKGKILPSNLALLEDRIALRKGKKQIYGSQVLIDSKTGKKYVAALKNPEFVNARRANVGLSSMEDYLMGSFKMKWDIHQYKKHLEQSERLQKEMFPSKAEKQLLKQ